MPKLKKAGISDAELLLLTNQIVGKWVPILGLLNWYIEVKIGDPENESLPEGTVAYVHWPNGYRHAYLYVMPSTDDVADLHTYDKFEFYVVHELCHMLTAEVCDEMELELGGEGLLYQRFAKGMETATDTIASAFLRLKG